MEKGIPAALNQLMWMIFHPASSSVATGETFRAKLSEKFFDVCGAHTIFAKTAKMHCRTCHEVPDLATSRLP